MQEDSSFTPLENLSKGLDVDGNPINLSKIAAEAEESHRRYCRELDAGERAAAAKMRHDRFVG